MPIEKVMQIDPEPASELECRLTVLMSEDRDGDKKQLEEPAKGPAIMHVKVR